MQELLLFQLDAHQFALPSSQVSRITLVAKVTPLPEAPPFVAGLVNLAGRYIPVIHMRSRFGLSAKPPELEEYFIMVRLKDQELALWVDKIGEIRKVDEHEITRREESSSLWPKLRGVTEIDQKTTLIYDLNACLSTEESAQLNKAIESYSTLQGGVSC